MTRCGLLSQVAGLIIISVQLAVVVGVTASGSRPVERAVVTGVRSLYGL